MRREGMSTRRAREIAENYPDKVGAMHGPERDVKRVLIEREILAILDSLSQRFPKISRVWVKEVAKWCGGLREGRLDVDQIYEIIARASTFFDRYPDDFWRAVKAETITKFREEVSSVKRAVRHDLAVTRGQGDTAHMETGANDGDYEQS